MRTYREQCFTTRKRSNPISRSILGKQIHLLPFHLYGGFPEERRALSPYLKGLSISPPTDKSAKKIDKIKKA